jgi:hypothetical protein
LAYLPSDFLIVEITQVNEFLPNVTVLFDLFSGDHAELEEPS